jgi:heme A synthase
VSSHFLLMVLFAFCVSTVFAVLMRDEPRTQVRFGALLLAAFVGVALVLGWLMVPLPL